MYPSLKWNRGGKQDCSPEAGQGVHEGFRRFDWEMFSNFEGNDEVEGTA